MTRAWHGPWWEAGQARMTKWCMGRWLVEDRELGIPEGCDGVWGGVTERAGGQDSAARYSHAWQVM